MKLGAIIIGLLIAAGVSLSASAAPTIALTGSPIIGQVAVPPNHRAPVAEVCNENDPSQLSDWGDRPGNPCWPCVRGDESITSTYAISEVRPYCQ
jgi:hypothetical protein